MKNQVGVVNKCMVDAKYRVILHIYRGDDLYERVSRMYLRH